MQRLFRWRRVLFALIFSASTLYPSYAAPIVGTTVSTNMGEFFPLIHLVDNSGLSSPYDPNASHGVGTPANVWGSIGGGVTTGQLTFTLPSLYDVSGVAIWNFNGFSNGGVRNFTLESSLDNLTYTPIAGIPAFLNQGANLASEFAQQIVFSAPVTANFIRLNILSNYGDTNGTGLSEVLFDGTLSAPSAAPELHPGSAKGILLFVLFGLLTATRKRSFNQTTVLQS